MWPRQLSSHLYPLSLSHLLPSSLLSSSLFVLKDESSPYGELSFPFILSAVALYLVSFSLHFASLLFSSLLFSFHVMSSLIM